MAPQAWWACCSGDTPIPKALDVGKQGIIGNIPGQALAFLTLYLQLLGLSPLRASLAVSGMMLAHALGGQLGGWLGDVAAARAPRAGRIIICQFSVAAGARPLLSTQYPQEMLRCVDMVEHYLHSRFLCQASSGTPLSVLSMLLGEAVGAGMAGRLLAVIVQDFYSRERVPGRLHAMINRGILSQSCCTVRAGTVLTAVILKGLPHKGASAAFPLYMLVFVANGALNAWPAPACNNPIFAEIVPARLRTFVYAFDRSFEMAVAACAAPVVARMAESLFGFQVRGGCSTTSRTLLSGTLLCQAG